MTSIQDKLRQGDVEFSSLPDEATLSDVLQHVHHAVQFDRATDTALKIVQSFNVDEIELMLRERVSHGGIAQNNLNSTPTAMLIELIRDDILTNESDDNTAILEKYGIAKEIERKHCFELYYIYTCCVGTSRNRRYWISVSVGVVSMLVFMLINLYRNRDRLGF